MAPLTREELIQRIYQLEGADHASRIATLETELTTAREEIAALKEERKNAAREYLHCDSARLELLQERDALKADKDRLDWLLSQGTYCPNNLTFQIDFYRTPRQTAIEAIDAARKAEGDRTTVDSAT